MSFSPGYNLLLEILKFHFSEFLFSLEKEKTNYDE